MKLVVEVKENKTAIKVDDYEFKDVTEYKLEGSATEGTELTIKMSIID